MSKSGVSMLATLTAIALAPIVQAITVHSDCDAYPFVAAAIPRVFGGAAQAANALNGPSNEVQEVAGWLFGPNTNWGEAQTRLNNVGANIPQDSQPGNPNEIYIYCAKNRYTDTDPPRAGYQWDQVTQTIHKLDDEWHSCFDDNAASPRVKAITTNYVQMDLSKPPVPTDIQFCPWYLDYINTHNYQVSVQAEADTSLWCRLTRAADALFSGKTDIDYRALFEHTFLHEVTHHFAVGTTQFRLGVAESYGWTNCVSAKDARNSESLAFFALGVDIVMNCQGESILEDGSILQPDQTQRRWLSWPGMAWSAYKRSTRAMMMIT